MIKCIQHGHVYAMLSHPSAALSPSVSLVIHDQEPQDGGGNDHAISASLPSRRPSRQDTSTVGGLLLAGKSDTVCSRYYVLDTCSNTVGEDLSDFDEDEHNALGNVDWKREGWCREGREPAIDVRVDVQECGMDEPQDGDGERGCERSKRAGKL